MKKIFTCLVLFLAMSVHPLSAKVEVGVMGGWNLTKVSFDKNSLLGSDNHSGWFLGPKVEFKLPIIGIGMDASALYSQKNLNVDANDASASKILRSLSVPVNLRYTLGFTSILAVYAATGPQFDFNLGNKDLNISTAQNMTLKSSNFSWNIGAGIRAVTHLELGVVYNMPLGKTGDINTSNAASNVSKIDVKSNTFQVSATYIF